MPSLDLRFAESKSLVDSVSGQLLITFTRASTGTFVDSDGVIRSAGNDVPRFEHNPLTGECLGLLVEEQRVNSIRNNTMVGAVAGTPGTLPTNWSVAFSPSGLSYAVVGTGSTSGIPYVDIQITGTPSANGTAQITFEQNAVIGALSGQTWTGSMYCSLEAGTLPGTAALLVIERSGAGSFLASSSTNFITVAGSLITQKTVHTRALNNASTAFTNLRIDASVTSGVAVDFTLRIGLPQLELGAFATSVIPTTGTAATRTADVVDVINQAIANNIRTLLLEFRSPAIGTRGVVSLNGNTANERAEVITSGTDPRLVVHDGGVEQANIDGGTVTANQRTRVAVRINANDFAISINGGTVVTDNSGTLPTVIRLMLGRTQAGEYLNAPLARVIGWQQLLPDSALQELVR
jgi:hypothetical protein